MAFSDKVIDGGDILLEIDGKVIGCATTHSIEVTSAVREVSCKGSGDWTSNEYSRLSWSGSTDALFNLEESGTFVRYADLYNLMITKQIVTVTSTYTEGTDTFTQTGEAVIASISKTAGDQENASYSVSLTGRGALLLNGAGAWNVEVTAVGATHVVCEETNQTKTYNGSPVTFLMTDGSYNFTAFDETTQGRASVTVSGADTTANITLA